MGSIDRHLLKDKVAAWIREQILSAKLQPDTPLIENELANRLGVSRTVVRGALSTLEGEGMVIMTPYKGTRVAEFTPEDLREIYRLRSLLEGYAMELLAKHCEQKDLEGLEAIAERMHKPAVMGNRRALAQLDFRFHRRLVALAGNKRLLAAWNAVGAQFLRSMALLSYYYEDVKSIPDHHKRYVQLIRGGDWREAGRYMHETIERNGELIARLLEHIQKQRALSGIAIDSVKRDGRGAETR